MSDKSIPCGYCGGSAPLVTGRELYPHRPDLAHVAAYWCRPCDARVGVHDGTDRPKGTLANAELRRARMDAHAAFDPLWRRGPRRRFRRRGEAYRWLAGELGLALDDTHIALFDEARSRAVVAACERLSVMAGETA